MIHHPPFPYQPPVAEYEKASSGYLMSLVAIMVGMPFPIVNLVATGIFYLGNRRGGYFTRWHCTQAMLSQSTLFIINIFAVSWTLYVFFGAGELNNYYIAYLITALLINLLEFIMTIYTAVKTRRGVHVEWWFWGPMAHALCRK